MMRLSHSDSPRDQTPAQRETLESTGPAGASLPTLHCRAPAPCTREPSSSAPVHIGLSLEASIQFPRGALCLVHSVTCNFRILTCAVGWWTSLWTQEPWTLPNATRDVSKAGSNKAIYGATLALSDTHPTNTRAGTKPAGWNFQLMLFPFSQMFHGGGEEANRLSIPAQGNGRSATSLRLGMQLTLRESQHWPEVLRS